MKHINKIGIATFILLCTIGINSTCFSQVTNKTNSNSEAFPPSIHYTSDFENILDQNEEDKLNMLISSIENETKLEFAVVSLSGKMIGKYDFQKYTLELANRWGVGKKELNNGIMIAFSTEKRQIYIQTGTGIEKIYTNAQVKSIIDKIIKPAFILQRYYEGLFAAILIITEELKPNLNKLTPKYN